MPQQNQNTANAGTITVTGKPSTSQAAKYYQYKNYTKTWRNYCPLCGRSGKLSDNPKGVPEGEITCDKSKGGCDADYDVCTGGDKSGRYRAYLQDANGRSNTKDNVDTSIGGGGEGAVQGTTATGGSAVQIPDLTFYGLIKQIMGATDAKFISANNMAYLLSYKDLHKYRDEYEEYIPEIKSSHILKDSIVQYWTTEGLYNAVEVTYKDGTIRYQHDLLVEQYGRQIKYYELKDDDEETAKAKAQSLLSTHVRDYSLDLQFNCLYNPHITVGTWVKVPKNIIKVESKQHKEKKSIKKKYKGVTISNITEKVETTKNGKKIKVEKITTEDKKTVEVKTPQNDYEMYYVQGYHYWWTPDHTPIMNIHLKYGPDTPEDPVNATIGIGGGGSGVVDAEGISERIKQLVAQIIGNETDILRKAQLVHEYIKTNNYYKRYDCMHQSSPDACLDNLPNLNCADTAQLTWAMMTAAGVQATVVHAPGHFWTVLTINGQKYASDGIFKHEFNVVASGWASKMKSGSYTECGPKPSC